MAQPTNQGLRICLLREKKEGIKPKRIGPKKHAYANAQLKLLQPCTQACICKRTNVITLTLEIRVLHDPFGDELDGSPNQLVTEGDCGKTKAPIHLMVYEVASNQSEIMPTNIQFGIV